MRIWMTTACVVGALSAGLDAQERPTTEDLKWRSPDGAPGEPRNLPDGQRAEPLEPLPRSRRPVVTRVSSGSGTLPNEHGQVWREYDIAPYTESITATSRPEQTILDWILRDTGLDLWHGDVVSILSADARRMRVYHTPEVQDRIARLVDRFVTRRHEETRFGVDVLSVAHPDWRTRLASLLRPVSVESPGVEAYVLSQQDAALLTSELGRRGNARPISTPGLSVLNGQPLHVVATRPRRFVQTVNWEQAVVGTAGAGNALSEGFAMEMTALMSLDGSQADVAIKATIDRVEKVHAVDVEVPMPGPQRRRTKWEVPQQVQFRMNELFRWPSDKVLVISTGMVPAPLPQENGGLLAGLLEDQRAEVLIVVRAGSVALPVIPQPGPPPNQPVAPASGPAVPQIRY